MANYSTSLTTWADSGASYPSDYSYAKGESPVDDWDDYLAYHTIEDIKHLISLTNALDTDLYAHTGDTGNPHSVDHSQLSGVGSGDHHTRYADSEAISAINNDADHGSTASHNYFPGGHSDLSGVGAEDHHSRIQVSDSGTAVLTQPSDLNFGANIDVTDDADGTVTVDGTPGYTDSDAISAINNDTDHGSTASHNYFSGSHTDLSNIGSSDHHAKYTDSEARSAVAAGDVDRVHFANQEVGNLSAYELAYDASDGFVFKDSGGTAGRLYDSQDNIPSHSDLSDAPASAHHTAHEHPGDRAAYSHVNVNGYDLHNVSQIDGNNGNHRIRFDSNNSWLEITDQSNNRNKVVTKDVYIDDLGSWMSSSPVSGLDADTVDGKHASDMGGADPSNLMMLNEGFAPGFGG